jgi:hypothetical protein
MSTFTRFRALALALMVLPLLAVAQPGAVQNDTIVQGASYVNDIWYSLTTGTKTSQPRAAWDLAFQISTRSAGIWVNTARGMRLYEATTDTSRFSTLTAADTVGKISSSQALWNSETTWANGAFNAQRSSSDQFDEGWGQYDITVHEVLGKRIFFLKLADNTWKKIWIPLLNPKSTSQTFYVRYANLDGTGDTVITIDRRNYAGKNFAYYSFAGKAQADLEPANTSWDLLFTRYNVASQLYTVAAGIFQNDGVAALKFAPVDVDTVGLTSASTATFSTAINVIGWDWKKTNMGVFTIEDSTTYLVKAKDGSIWKLIFTSFVGQSAGRSTFTKQRLAQATSTEGDLSRSLNAVLFPNPASGSSLVNLAIDNNANLRSLNLRIVDLTGRTLRSSQLELNAGLNALTLNTAELGAGLYLVQLDGEGYSQSLRLVVNR